MEKPGLYFRTNVSYSNNVIGLAAEAGCNRFVLSSTAAVYASSDQPLTEDSPINPANVYGETRWYLEMENGSREKIATVRKLRVIGFKRYQSHLWIRSPSRDVALVC